MAHDVQFLVCGPKHDLISLVLAKGEHGRQEHRKYAKKYGSCRLVHSEGADAYFEEILILRDALLEDVDNAEDVAEEDDDMTIEGLVISSVLVAFVYGWNARCSYLITRHVPNPAPLEYLDVLVTWREEGMDPAAIHGYSIHELVRSFLDGMLRGGIEWCPEEFDLVLHHMLADGWLACSEAAQVPAG